MLGCCEHGNKPSDSITCGEFFLTSRETVSCSRRTLPQEVRVLSYFPKAIQVRNLHIKRNRWCMCSMAVEGLCADVIRA